MAKKIIVRAPNWLGDAVMSTGFIKRLRTGGPQNEIHVLCPSGISAIFSNYADVNQVISFEPGDSIRALIQRVRAGHYDLGYVLPPSFSSAFVFWAAGVPERIGYSSDFRRFLLTHPLRLDERFHYVRRYLGLLKQEGSDVDSSELYFPRPAVESDKFESLTSVLKINLQKPCLAVAPGSNAPARRWFADRYAEFINRLAEKDWPTVLLVGSKGDRPVVDEVQKKCTRPVMNVCGQTTLVQLGEILRRCDALVTNESGCMHVAWAVGTPTVVLAGPSDPRLTSPFGNKVKILHHPEIPCVPCVKNDCFRAPDEYCECLKQISVDDVVNALGDLTKGFTSK